MKPVTCLCIVIALLIEIVAVLEDQPSGRVVEPYWVGQSLIPRSEGRAFKTPPPSLVLNSAYA